MVSRRGTLKPTRRRRESELELISFPVSLCLVTDDFQASSKELEDELERELAANEARHEDLTAKNVKLEGEKEEWKVSSARVARHPIT